MSSTVVQFPHKRPVLAMLRCPKCGVTEEAPCACGVPYEYIPPGKLAAKALTKDSHKSDRTIADELGISHKTVGRARRSPTVTNVSVEKRLGKDGRVRKLPNVTSLHEEEPREDTAEEKWQRSLGNFASDAVKLEAFWKREFSDWDQFTVPSHLLTLAEQALKSWSELLPKLRRMS